MTDRRPTDAQLGVVLRTRLPRPEANLGEWIRAEVATTRQEQALPSILGALTDADPVGRRRSLIVAAALLAVSLLAAAAVVGGLLRTPTPDLNLAPPDDVNAFVGEVYAGLVELPALAMTIESEGYVYRYFSDGAGAIREERPETATYSIISRDKAVEVGPYAPGSGDRAWVDWGPPAFEPSFVIAVWTFREGPDCASSWQYVALETVLERSTRHVVCPGGDAADYWIDVETGLVLRAPNFEVVELSVGPQPPDLFDQAPPAGMPVITRYDYICSTNPGSRTCSPGESGSPAPIRSPAPAPVQDSPLADPGTLVAELIASYERLPAFEATVSVSSDSGCDRGGDSGCLTPGLGGFSSGGSLRLRQLSDGRGGFRQEWIEDGVMTAIWIKTPEHLYEGGEGWPWHDYGPRAGIDIPDWTLGVPEACEAGWEQLGLDLVLDRPAHHLRCGLLDAWIDRDWLIVVRTQTNPDALHLVTQVYEVSDIQFRDQPAELFGLPPGTDVFCPSCPSPSPGSAAP